MKIYKNKSHFFFKGGGGAPVLAPPVCTYMYSYWGGGYVRLNGMGVN